MLSWVAALAVLGDIRGDVSSQYTKFATKLADDLIGPNSNYNKVIPPESVRDNNYSRAGTDVSLQLRFFKVDEGASAPI